MQFLLVLLWYDFRWKTLKCCEKKSEFLFIKLELLEKPQLLTVWFICWNTDLVADYFQDSFEAV